MICLNKNDTLSFRFPEVHPDAALDIDLQRTLRIPDDGKDYPLPPGLGTFPLEHVDDHAERVPAAWLRRSGVMLPMYQAEALWLRFNSAYIDKQGNYPFAIKVGTGKINAVTGGGWNAALHRKPQDYVVAPRQPWLDGYAVGKGVVRQFVAMPMGKGYSVEEQITGSDQFGGIQVQAYPMKRAVFEKRFPQIEPVPFSIRSGCAKLSIAGELSADPAVKRKRSKPDLGVAPGGRIKQQIFDDGFNPDDWDLSQSSRCFVHLCNSMQWKHLIGKKPPTRPISARQYRKHGLPWFSYYKEKARVLDGSAKLASLETVAGHARTIGDGPQDENESISIEKVIELRQSRRDGQVRERGW